MSNLQKINEKYVLCYGPVGLSGIEGSPGHNCYCDIPPGHDCHCDIPPPHSCHCDIKILFSGGCQCCSNEVGEMLPFYNFSGGVRGKYVGRLNKMNAGPK